ncbi:hypothetical protein BDB00DRAFT_608717 [Zychaea mexicana]|uniref:uncharacterized protein n=1 Tax=Zychaea mexicana TaxID=64656 RepID=UPI0022FDD561|nr:uncharacterized protein BDB00DRAFT_608717 [Zychaea mexicana]KAI9489559.1 hypothetical protein BDB00DRAFT_608717 [Zychaea mexicana]
MSMVNFPADFQILSYLTAEIPIDIGTLPIPENHIPPIPLKPQFASFLDTYSASNSTTPAASNNSEEATAEKTHMLKKMQRMLRRSSGPVPKKGESTDQPGEQLPMNKNELLALFADNASLKGRSSLNSSSDDSAISRASIRGGGGVHSSMSTTDSVGSEILTQLQKGLPPPPPSLPPPKQPNTDAFATLPSSFRLSLGPEFSAAVLSSELAKQRQQRHEKSPTPSASSSTSLEHYKSTPKASVADNLHFHHLHRRRINSDSIVLDKPSSSMKDHISNNDLQKQQRPHPLTSSNSAAAVGGVHYFYPFDDSSSDEEVEEQQQQSNNSNRSAAVALQQRRRRKSSRRCRATTTAAGYEKPNSVSNNLDASEAQVERLEVHYNKNSDTASTSSPSRPSYPVTHVDKPDELTASDTDASSNEEDLLDILSRRDRRIASRMTTHQQQ